MYFHYMLLVSFLNVQLMWRINENWSMLGIGLIYFLKVLKVSLNLVWFLNGRKQYLKSGERCGWLFVQKKRTLSLFTTDDDNFSLTVHGLPRPVSWLGIHTESVIAAMATVWYSYSFRKSEPKKWPSLVQVTLAFI